MATDDPGPDLNLAKLLIPLLAGAAIFGVAWYLSKAGPGGTTSLGLGSVEVEQVVAYHDDGRGHLTALVDADPTWQLMTWELETGELLAQDVVDRADGSRDYRLLRRVGSRSWALDSEGRLELVDLSGARVLLTEADLAEAIPDLAEGFELRIDTVNDYSPPMPGVKVLLRDGRLRWIDMGALAEAPVLAKEAPPTDPWRPGYFCGIDRGAKPSCQRTECLSWWPTEGSTAMVLGSSETWREREGAEGPRGEGTPLLRPGLVELLETECAFETGDGEVLVAHDSAAIEPRETLVSLLDRQGRRLWTHAVAELTEHAGAEPRGAFLDDGIIVLLLDDDDETLDLVRLSPAGEILLAASLL